MRKHKLEIIDVNADRLQWTFAGSAPSVMLPGLKWRGEPVDPFPAYAHDPKLAALFADRCVQVWPLGYSLTYFLIPFEGMSRTNGLSNYEASGCRCSDCVREGKSAADELGYVVLHAKRIPPHPAMTRYLVAHEYGHHVENWLERLFYPSKEGTLPAFGSGKLIEEYAKLRGLENIFGHGGTWHRSPVEVFACDFRCFIGIEPEFWPHAGIARYSETPAVQEWWREAHEKWIAHIATGESPDA